MLTKSLLFALSAQSAAASWLFARHHGSHDNESHGHGNGTNLTNFTTTASSLEWPGCPQSCGSSHAHHLSDDAHHPLCLDEDFYANITSCVASNCTEYEQGAFAILAEVECPVADWPEANITAEGVRANLSSAGGSPQTCHNMGNETIHCVNGTENEGSGHEHGGESSAGVLRVDSWYWMSSTVVLSVICGMMS